MIKNIENVSILFKLNSSMEKLEKKCILRNVMLKFSKVGFEKSGCHGNGLNGTGTINTLFSSPINFMKNH